MDGLLREMMLEVPALLVPSAVSVLLLSMLSIGFERF